MQNTRTVDLRRRGDRYRVLSYGTHVDPQRLVLCGPRSPALPYALEPATCGSGIAEGAVTASGLGRTRNSREALKTKSALRMYADRACNVGLEPKKNLSKNGYGSTFLPDF